MKLSHISLAFLFVALSCKSQNIQALEGPYNHNIDQPRPIYVKDLNNIRAPFIGVWQGNDGNKELTIFLYELNDVPNGLYGSVEEQFKDGIMGYYIYKENNVEVLNTRQNLLDQNISNKQQYGPIFGFTSDGLKMTGMGFLDYGINILQEDGTQSDSKRGVSNIEIVNPLEATFNLENQPHIMGPYNYDFSIPTSLTLTKISDTPPPL